MKKNNYNPIKSMMFDGKEVKAILAQCRTDGDPNKWSKALTSTALMEFALIFQSLRASFGDALANQFNSDLGQFDIGKGIYATVTTKQPSTKLDEHWEIDVMPDDDMRALAHKTFTQEIANSKHDVNETELAKFIEFSINSWIAHNLMEQKADFFVYTGESFLLADDIDEMNDSVAMLDANVGVDELVAMGRAKKVVSMSVYNLEGCILKMFTTVKSCVRLYNMMERYKAKDGHIDTAIEVALESVVRDPAHLGDNNWLVLVSDNDTAFRQGPLLTWDLAVNAVIKEFGGLHD